MSSPLNSPVGKEMLMHAASQDYCVLEFQKNDAGELVISDITDHVEQLEEMADINNA